MTNNDILRRLRYALKLNDQKMIEIFSLGGKEVSQSDITNWLKKEEEAGYTNLADVSLATFLNGLIVKNRGAKDDKPLLAEKKLNNNLILIKLKIALNLKDDDVQQMLEAIGFRFGKAELSAFFRRKDHKHFRECKDQVLRNFLNAIQHKYRPSDESGRKAQSKRDQAIARGDIKAPQKKTYYVNPNAKPKEKEKAESKDKKRDTLSFNPSSVWKKQK